MVLLVGELTGHVGGLDKGAEVSGHGTFSEHLACRLLLIADHTCPLVVLTALLSLLHLPFTNNTYQQIQVQNSYIDRRMVAMYRSEVETCIVEHWQHLTAKKMVDISSLSPSEFHT